MTDWLDEAAEMVRLTAGRGNPTPGRQVASLAGEKKYGKPIGADIVGRTIPKMTKMITAAKTNDMVETVSKAGNTRKWKKKADGKWYTEGSIKGIPSSDLLYGTKQVKLLGKNSEFNQITADQYVKPKGDPKFLNTDVTSKEDTSADTRLLSGLLGPGEKQKTNKDFTDSELSSEIDNRFKYADGSEKSNVVDQKKLAGALWEQAKRKDSNIPSLGHVLEARSAWASEKNPELKAKLKISLDNAEKLDKELKIKFLEKFYEGKGISNPIIKL